MNWWYELPKLDLTTALQIKGASGEILQLKGVGFQWNKLIEPVRYEQVVFMGDSIFAALFGNSLTTPSPEATELLGLPVYSEAVNGRNIAAVRGRVSDVLAAFPEVGKTLFVVHAGINDVTGVLIAQSRDLTAADMADFASRYHSLLDAFGEYLPHVHLMPVQWTGYWQNGYSAREAWNNPRLTTGRINQDVLPEIISDRLSQALYYPNGDSYLEWYDQNRNEAGTWMQPDGVHHISSLLTPTIRPWLINRLRIALDGNIPPQIAPAPRDALAALTPSIVVPIVEEDVAISHDLGQIFNLHEAVVSVVDLPAWATLTDLGRMRFRIAGTPQEAGAYSFKINATLDGQTAEVSVSGEVGSEPASTMDTFSVPNETAIGNYVGESGEAWVPQVGTTLTGITITNGTARATNSGRRPYSRGTGDILDQWSEISLQVGTSSANLCISPAVRVSPNSAYYLGYQLSSSRVLFGTIKNGALGPWSGFSAPKPVTGDKLRLEVRDNDTHTAVTLRALINGVVVATWSPTEYLPAGRGGLLADTNAAVGVGIAALDFDAGAL